MFESGRVDTGGGHGRAGPAVHRRAGCVEQPIDGTAEASVDGRLAAQPGLQLRSVQLRREVGQLVDGGQPVGARREAQAADERRIELLVDLGLEPVDASVVGQAELLEAEDDDDRVDPIAVRDRHDLFERRRGAHQLDDAGLGHQELGRERVRLDLVGVRGASAQRGERVDLKTPVVTAEDVGELVSEREALARVALRAVDPDDRRIVVAIAGAGHAVGEGGDDGRQPGLLFDERQQARDWRGGIQPEGRARLAGAFGATVRVLRGHRAHMRASAGVIVQPC